MEDPILRDSGSEAHYTIEVTDLNVDIKGEQQSFYLKGESVFLEALFRADVASVDGYCERRADVPEMIQADFLNLSSAPIREGTGAHFEAVSGNFGTRPNGDEGTAFAGYLSNNARHLSFNIVDESHSWSELCGEEETPEMKEKEACVARGGQWSENVVRSSFPLVHSIIELMERNPECGFQSDDVLAHSSWNGTIGRADGTVTYEREPCLIELRAETPIQENAMAKPPLQVGQFGFLVKKELRVGSNHPIRSVVPNSANATTYALTIQFEKEQLGPSWLDNVANSLRRTPGHNETSERTRFEHRHLRCSDTGDALVAFRVDGWPLYNKASQWCFPNPNYHRKSRGARGKTPLKTNMFAGEVNVEGEVFALPLREKRGSVDESLLKLLDSYRCDVQVDYRPDATACDYINVLGAHAAQELLGHLRSS